MLRSTYRFTNTRGFSTPSSFDVDLVNSDYASKSARASIGRSHQTGENVFRMVLPPPNVTGKLHLGHALTVTVEDSIARHHRIRGQMVEWLPGFDHAGIATQSVVERELWREKGITRTQMSREEFLGYCREWAERNSSVITEQLKRLGASLDWNKSYYTLDENFSSAVTRAFCELHAQGQIYRDKRLVHWCPHLSSGLSDQEVERIDVPASGTISVPSRNGGKRNVTVGQMYSVRYASADGNGFLEVGTTRPETVFADVALAVHPSDERYTEWRGKTVEHPFLKGQKMAIIFDEAVQRDKGTGVVKITPSHDHLDAEIAARHWEEIELIYPDARSRVCLDDSGFLINSVPEYDGMDRFEAREKIISELSSRSIGGQKMEFTAGQVSICSRTGDVIEPRLTSQWFMDCTEMHKEAEIALRDGRIRVVPGYQEQKLLDWFSYSEPWCLSRQLVWGHRIPAYRNKNEDSNWVVARSRPDAIKLLRSEHIEQDNDVLDTWFSSALVPLVTSGWMSGRQQLGVPPIALMETGNDILGFWVARMIIMTMRLSKGQIPFPRILLHGLVRDPSGRKMSKSLGNVIDPLDVLDGISQENMMNRIRQSGLPQKEIEAACADINIRYPNGLPRAGVDALRFALLRHDITSADVPLNVAVLADEGLKFCNKLWNLTAYVEEVRTKLTNAGHSEINNNVELEAADHWLLSRLQSTLTSCDMHMNADQPHLAFQNMHKFILSNLCDVYLETTKRALWSNDSLRLQTINSVLSRVMNDTLCQLSAFMPFISEHLYERLRKNGSPDIHEMTVKPDPSLISPSLESSMNCALSVVSAVRSVKAQLQLPQKMAFEGVFYSSTVDISELSSVVSSLCDLRLSEVDSSLNLKSGYMPCPIPGFEAKLAIRIEESHRTEFIDRLYNQLQKSLERARQFREKGEKYQAIVERDKQEGKVKKSVIDKNERKARQALSVSEASRNESVRLRGIIDEVEMQTNTETASSA